LRVRIEGWRDRKTRGLPAAQFHIHLYATINITCHGKCKMSKFQLASLSYIFILPALAHSALVMGEAENSRLTIDSSHVIGTIKPLQDMGIGPLLFRDQFDVTPYYKKLGVRYVRLHDVPYVYDDVQDMEYVFPKESADPMKAENYDFVLTDHYIESITSAGMNMIYRLGYTSDYYRPRALQFIDPPRSYKKWADVATHIVNHYNNGWDGGPRTHIKYWEIWNEPDIPISWTGTPEAYFKLYEVVAKQIKATDPSLKVGGPALAEHLDFLESFLKYCRSHQAPVDFVSWHNYPAKPEEVAKRGQRVHDLMVKYGFGGAQSILDEWNYSFTGIFDPSQPNQADGNHKYYEITRGEVGAAFDAAVLIALQDAAVDIATFYTGTNMVMGLFTYEGGPTKAYYSFLAFRTLLDSPQRVAVNGTVGADVTALAGLSVDRRTLRVLIAHTGNGQREFGLQLAHLPWSGAAIAQIQTIDGKSEVALTKPKQIAAKDGIIHIKMEGPAVQLLTISAS
jgi:xylan 1,4-beta-xylosidase